MVFAIRLYLGVIRVCALSRAGRGGKMSTEIEERLAHLERLADELSTVVAGQAVEIDRLTARVRKLMEREAMREAEGSGGVVLGDERPPHY